MGRGHLGGEETGKIPRGQKAARRSPQKSGQEEKSECYNHVNNKYINCSLSQVPRPAVLILLYLVVKLTSCRSSQSSLGTILKLISHTFAQKLLCSICECPSPTSAQSPLSILGGQTSPHHGSLATEPKATWFSQRTLSVHPILANISKTSLVLYAYPGQHY